MCDLKSETNHRISSTFHLKNKSCDFQNFAGNPKKEFIQRHAKVYYSRAEALDTSQACSVIFYLVNIA